MDHLYTPTGHTYIHGGDTCLDLHVITDGEWEYNHDTGGSYLRVLDSEPTKCGVPHRDPVSLLTKKYGNCDKEYDPIPF